MSATEDRIRRGLDADVLVSADEMLGAALLGIRRRRRRQVVTVAVATVAAVVLGVVAGTAPHDRTSKTPVPVELPKVKVEPSRLDWYSGIATDGTTLYLASHRCPGSVVAGLCTYPSNFSDAVSLDKAFPVVLWRYTDGGWERLGSAGVTDLGAMVAFPGGLLLMPAVNIPDQATYWVGPLRMSLDRGTTWVDWQLPWPGTKRCKVRSSLTCGVAVAGDYVVVASGDAWARRSIHSGGWEDISPPRRAARQQFDNRAYGMLALADGTLVATANDDAHPDGFFRVSRDVGSTWSAPRTNPGGGTASLDRTDGSTVYATCWQVVPGTGGSTRECGTYWSADLVTWTKAGLEYVREPTCRALRQLHWRTNEDAVRVGALRYRLALMRYLDGHIASAGELPRPDRVRHQIRHVLQVSRNSCLTWERLLE
jgi:hypothetical protein